MHPKDAEGIANSEDPDQTAPLGAVWSGSAVFAQTCLSERFGTLWYWGFFKHWMFECAECFKFTLSTSGIGSSAGFKCVIKIWFCKFAREYEIIWNFSLLYSNILIKIGFDHIPATPTVTHCETALVVWSSEVFSQEEGCEICWSSHLDTSAISASFHPALQMEYLRHANFLHKLDVSMMFWHHFWRLDIIFTSVSAQRFDVSV